MNPLIIVVIIVIVLIVWFVTSGPKKGRYVILERVADSKQPTGDGNTLSIGEIVVYDPAGKNITKQAKATMSTAYGGSYGVIGNAVDGNINTVSHTASNVTNFANIWLNLDFGSDVEIGRVEVYNRQDAVPDRINGIRLRVKNDAGADVYVAPTIAHENGKTPLKFEYKL
jgi:hypothetical protein